MVCKALEDYGKEQRFEGAIEFAIEAAKRMIVGNEPVEDIARYTDLSVEIIKNLQDTE